MYSSFNYEICQLEYRSQCIMAACNILNYGDSDEGTLSVAAGNIKTFLKEMRIVGISDADIAKALPSRATRRNGEAILSVDCLIKVCYEISVDSDGFDEVYLGLPLIAAIGTVKIILSRTSRGQVVMNLAGGQSIFLP